MRSGSQRDDGNASRRTIGIDYVSCVCDCKKHFHLLTPLPLNSVL